MRYSLDALAALLPEPVEPTKPILGKTFATGTPFVGESVIDAYNRMHLITDVMLAYGYTKHYGVKWNRPGAKSHGCTVFPETNTMYSHSQNDPMFTDGQHSSRPFDMYCHFEHNDDCRAAVKAAAAELGIEKKRPQQPEPTFTQLLQAAREWVVTADFAALIPAHLHSATGYRTAATDKRAFDACLDVFEKYGKFSGPISQQQGHMASGLSSKTFGNAMERLIESPIIKRIESAESVEGGAYWYEINTCVLYAVGVIKQATLPRVKYASVFSQQKAEDAWQLRGSKSQSEKALVKACGPAGLLVVSVLPVGERVHQAIVGERACMKASAISRIVKRLEDYNMVRLERIGRDNYITLLPDWQDRLNEVVKYMPTYGNKFRRVLNDAIRTGENCDRKLARGFGDKVKLSAQRETAAKRAFAMIEQELASLQGEGQILVDTEKVSERIRRLTRYDALRQSAATETKTAKTVEIAMINRAKPQPWFDNQKESRRMIDIRQQLEDNETLIYAREQMRRAA